MIAWFSAKGIDFLKLVRYKQPLPYACLKLEEYKKACASRNSDAKDPKALKKLLQDTVETRCTFIPAVSIPLCITKMFAMRLTE